MGPLGAGRGGSAGVAAADVAAGPDFVVDPRHAVYIGLLLGGYLPVPGPLEGPVEWVWERWS
jgi:hypothetical protein